MDHFAPTTYIVGFFRSRYVAVEVEQAAHDDQQRERNQELNPVIIALRDALIRLGVPLEPEVTRADPGRRSARDAERVASVSDALSGFLAEFLQLLSCSPTITRLQEPALRKGIFGAS